MGSNSGGAGNTAIGSALIIPDGLLNELDKVDYKIKNIQDTSRATANVFNTSFASMSAGLKTGILTQLQQVINQLGQVGQAAQTASSATQNMGSGLGTAAQGATNFGTSITGVVEAINRMIGQLQQSGQVGSSSLMAAKLAADKLMEAMQFKNTGNIATIKDEIQSINKIIKDTESALSRSEQQALVERKRLLQEELKEAERTQNERAVNLQRVLDRMVMAEQRYQKRVEQARKKTAQEYQRENYANNTTYSGSLSFADNANTINRRTQAIKYLTEARNTLSKTDGDYIEKLKQLNAKIKELNAENRQAIAGSLELSNSHRRLMDTSGQLQRAFAAMFSVSQIHGYINQIAKVRGEFELQQRSLEVILQNKTEADTIFNKTVALAVHSPFQIRELVTYTKQLAAYRIESDKLYDTTKRLADVSAGLGVDMQRLILAYGQVKAAAYLRGCLGYNTPIRMYDGSIRMVQDVQVGDVLINENGDKVNVKELIRGREKMYIINQLCGNDRTMYKVNVNHILTLWNVAEQRLEDIYLSDYLKDTEQLYLGVKVQDNGERFYYAIEAIECGVDNYYGFVLDGNKRFLLGDGTITHNTEVRQFTEAGINLYGELQRYFQEVKGEAYTTAQIVDMISKRMVTFEDVEQIFKRITDQGGIFYRMQEIQAETLQGKMANFKDSVDVMMNEIGKENEGLFKGAIDSATALLDHWEAVVNVGKVLAGVIISVTLSSKVLGGSFGFAAQKAMLANKGFMNMAVLSSLLDKAVAGLSSSFTRMKMIFAGALPLMGIMAALELFGELVKVTQEYNENVRKANKDFFTAKVAIRDIKETSKTDVNKALDSLVKEMNNKGYEITIPVNLTEKQAKEKLDEYLAEYERFLEEKLAIDYRYAENKRKGWMLGDDDIDTDMEEVSESAGKLIANGQEIRVVLEKVNADTKIMTESQRQLFDEMLKGPQKGEELIDYYLRVADVLEKLGYNMPNFNDYQTDEQKKLRQLILSAKEYRADLQEAKKEIQDVFGDFDKKRSEQEKKRISQHIDLKANEENWDAWIVEKLKLEYGIKVKIDEKNAQKQINYLDDMIQKTIGDKTYKLNIAVSKTFFDTLADAVDDAGKIVDAAGTWNKIINSKGIVEWGYAKQDSEFEKWYRNVWRPSMKNTPISDAMKLSDLTMKRYAEYRQKLAQATLDTYGLTSKGQEKSAKSAAKSQRDILSERISLLKEMQDRYEKLRTLIGDTDAAQSVRTSFADALEYVKMPKNIVDSFVPSKEGLAKAYEQLLSSIPNKIENFKKRAELEKSIATLKLDIDTERAREKLDGIKKYVQNVFSQKELHGKLSDIGLSDVQIREMFGFSTRSFDEIRKAIEDKYASEYGADKTKWGKNIFKQYEDEMKDLDKRVYEDQISEAQRLLKAYKTQLSEQLQLDKWYYEELAKIRSNENIAKDPELRKQLEENLKKGYDRKSADNAWKEFTSSESYISLFNNIEYYSTAALQGMKDRLGQMREELKDLSPTELKQIMEQESELEEQLNSRNPWKNLIKSLKDYTTLRKGNAKNEKAETAARNKQLQLAKQLGEQSKVVAETEAQLKLAKKDAIDVAQTEYDSAKKVYDELEKQKKAVDEIVDGYDRANSELTKQAIKVQDIIQSLGKVNLGKGMVESISGQTNSVSGFAHMLADDFGVAIGDEVFDVLEGVGALFESIESFDIQKPVSSIMNVLTGLGKTIAAVFGYSSKDNKREKEIQAYQSKIEDLQRAYKNLKKAMDDAWSFTTLNDMQSGAVNSIRKQNEALQKMINAERGKKHSDAQRIKEYQQQIEDNIDRIREIQESVVEAAGGFGSEANYKSAAEKFAEAWVNAFKESNDTLEALNNTFGEFVANLVKKQIVLKAAELYLRPVFESLDDLVSEKLPGEQTAKIKKRIEEKKREIQGVEWRYPIRTEAVNERLRNLKEELQSLNTELEASYNVIAKKDLTPQDVLEWLKNGGIKNAINSVNEGSNGWGEVLEVVDRMFGISSNSDLSKLQQGIQSLTESTGVALESVLNSIRFFVSKQCDDVFAIREMVQSIEARISVSADSPTLLELRTQTLYLKDIRDMFSVVVKRSGHPQQGGGIKVFMD